MKYLVLGLVAACGSPHAGLGSDAGHGDAPGVVADASIDARPDAPPDAPPDAALPPPCSTTVDLDGDGLGWECDPVEHISIPNTEGGSGPTAHLYDGVFAAVFGTHCNSGPCTDRVAIEVRPDRAMVRRSDSGLPEDAWLKASSVGGPCVDAEHSVWWSSTATGMTGTLSSLGVFSPIASPLLDGCVTIGDETVLLGMATNPLVDAPMTSLMVPSGGALLPFASADFGSLYINPTIGIGFAPAILGIAGRSSSSTAMLMQARPGELTPSEVLVDGAPTTVVDVAERLPSTDNDAHGELNARSPVSQFFVRRNSKAYIVAITATTVQWWLLPRTDLSCSRSPSDVVYCLAAEAPQVLSLYIVHGNAVVPVFEHVENDDPAAMIEVFGSTLQVIRFGESYWAVDAAGDVTLLTASLVRTRRSLRDDAVVVTGVSATGSLVLVRYRPALGREEITIENGIDAGFTPSVFLTAEGDTIIGGAANLYVVQATFNVGLPLLGAATGVAGFARGDTTVVIANNALYAYDELGPGPRLTQLVAPLPNQHAVPLDPDHGAPTNYFAYGAGTARVARIAYTGMTPTLVERSCVDVPEATRMYGRTHDGVPVAACMNLTESYVLALTTSQPEVTAHYGGLVMFYLDHRFAEHPVVAYSGRAWTSGHDTICLASHPERCWRMTGAGREMLDADSVADWFSLFTFDVGATIDVWIVRPLGLGEEPQPIP